MSLYNSSLDHIVGIDVFLERFQTRLYVGKLEKKENAFHFTYDLSYLKTPNILSVGPELPLTRQHFISDKLFPSFLDRLPDPDNPAYGDYCTAAGIPEQTTDLMILLATIGKRGPSSFIFEPIYEDIFNFNACETFREKMGLSMQDFAYLFDVSLSILQKIKAGGSSGKEILKRLDIFMNERTILYKQIKKNMGRLHTDKQRELMFHLLKETLTFLDTPLLSFDKAYNLIEQAIDSRWYITDKNDQTIKKEIKRFNSEIKPIFKIAAYFKLIGRAPHHITFCTHNEALGYDGIFHWPNHEIRLEVTRAMDDEEGENEHLAKEDAKRRPMIGSYINYKEYNVTKPSQLSDNLPTHTFYTDPSHQDINGIIQHLRNAFDRKNDKGQYNGMWLIMTLSLRPNIKRDFELNPSRFYEVCHKFWETVDIIQCKFNRVFILTEKFIHSSEELNAPNNSLQNVLWDSGLLSHNNK